MEEKLSFFRETRHAFGRTALLLSGGGSLGSFHLVRPASTASMNLATAVHNQPRLLSWCMLPVCFPDCKSASALGFSMKWAVASALSRCAGQTVQQDTWLQVHGAG